MPTVEELTEALNTVDDPELGMGVVDLGLVYDVRWRTTTRSRSPTR